MGQSLASAIASVGQDKVLHSMHSYFLRAGKETMDIIYTVANIRDGQSFSTRSVVASQAGKKIFVLVASFQKLVVSRYFHQAPMPAVPDPTTLLSEVDYFRSVAEDPRCPGPAKPLVLHEAEMKRLNPVDIRPVVVHDLFRNLPFPAGYQRPHRYPEFSKGSKQLVWMKSRLPLPDDENVHRSALAYASDLGLVSTATGGLSAAQISMMASLDHSMWFHAPFRMDEWMLYEMESPRFVSERGLAFGRIFRRDGTLAVTVSQEGLIRTRSEAKL